MDTRTRNILAREFGVFPEEVEELRLPIRAVIQSGAWNPRKCYDVGEVTEAKIHAWAGTSKGSTKKDTDQVFGVVVARILDADECVRSRFHNLPYRTKPWIAEALKLSRKDTAQFRWLVKKGL